MKKWLISAVAACTLLIAACGAVTTSGPTITNTKLTQLGDLQASIDVVDIDQAAHRLYAADRTDDGVDVFDVSTPTAKYLTTIHVTSPSGLALAPDLGEVFVGGGDGISVIDVRAGSKTANTVIKLIPTDHAVDLIDYAPSVHKVFGSTAGHGTVPVIDTTTDTLKQVISLGVALEQPRFNPADGDLYVLSPAAFTLFDLNATTGAIKNKIATYDCGNGLAIDPKTDQAMLACGPYVGLLDLRHPNSLGKFVSINGGDVVTFDTATDRFLVAAPDSHPSRVGIFGGNPIAYIGSVDTGSVGNSAVFDDTNKLIYTSDTRAGKAGLDSFAMPSGQQTLSASWADIVIFAGLLLAVIVVMLLIGRHADPINRPEPVRRRRHVGHS